MFEPGALVAVALFVLGATYQVGRHSQRITALEEWRLEARQQHGENLKALEEIRDELRSTNGHSRHRS